MDAVTLSSSFPGSPGGTMTVGHSIFHCVNFSYPLRICILTCAEEKATGKQGKVEKGRKGK